MIGYNHIPIDAEILKQIEEFGFNAGLTRKCLDANKHTHETTTYYLLLKKKARREGIDVSQVLSAQLNEDTPKKLRKSENDTQLQVSGEFDESHKLQGTRRSLGGSDPRNKRALDLNEA